MFDLSMAAPLLLTALTSAHYACRMPQHSQKCNTVFVRLALLLLLLTADHMQVQSTELTVVLDVEEANVLASCVECLSNCCHTVFLHTSGATTQQVGHVTGTR
jgi:hypothetical protein